MGPVRGGAGAACEGPVREGGVCEGEEGSARGVWGL